MKKLILTVMVVILIGIAMVSTGCQESYDMHFKNSGDYQNQPLLNVSFSKPDKPALIQHIFISYKLCARHDAKESEIQ